MAEGLRSLARNLVDQVSQKRGRSSLESSPTKPARENILEPVLPSPKRRRNLDLTTSETSVTGSAMEPEGVQPLNFVDALKAQEGRLHSYLEKRFCALSEQLRDLTMRQADHEKRIVELESLEARVELLLSRHRTDKDRPPQERSRTAVNWGIA